jgi:hypothetical protein
VLEIHLTSLDPVVCFAGAEMVDFIPLKKVFQLFTDPDSAHRCARDDSDHSDSVTIFPRQFREKGCFTRKDANVRRPRCSNGTFFFSNLMATRLQTIERTQRQYGTK